MKFGVYLATQKENVWGDYCIDYDRLKSLINTMEQSHVDKVTNSRTTSLSGLVTHPLHYVVILMLKIMFAFEY